MRLKCRATPLVVGLLCAVSLVFPAATPAAADDYDQCDNDTGCEPDNHEQEWCRSGSAWWNHTNLANILSDEMADLEAETTFNSVFRGSCDGGTDIKFLVEYDVKSWQGKYQCMDFNLWGDCDNANVWLRPNSMSTDSDRQQTACHEIGHAGGLTHHGSTYSDCMASTTTPTSGQLNYNSHHENHMNTFD